MKRLIFFLLFVAAGSLLAQAPTVGSCPVFPADNIWNTPVDTLPVSPNSAVWVNTIGSGAPFHPDFASGYSLTVGIPFTQVKGNQTKYPATFQYQDQSDPGPYAIPVTAPIEGGTNGSGDRHVISVDTQNCILYEIFDAFPVSSPASWTGGSGAIFNLLSDALRPNDWTSADAAGLPVFAGLIRYDEILTGQIRHAIRFTAPQTQQAWVWPARHQASSLESAQYPPMGARFRLRAGFDISGYSAINQIILLALKKYGIMLADNGSSWYVTGTADSRWNNSDLHFLTALSGSDFEAVDVSPLMTNVDSGQATRIAVSVAVSQPGGTAMINSTEQFTASVAGTSNPGVTWDVDGIAGGNSTLGTIGANGLYTAPAAVPAESTVTIHANSVAAAATGSGVLIISGTRVGILPSGPSVLPGATQKFTASVQDVPNGAVIWYVNGVQGGNSSAGTIGPDGTYVAPVPATPGQTVQITAVYSSDASGSGTVIATII